MPVYEIRHREEDLHQGQCLECKKVGTLFDGFCVGSNCRFDHASRIQSPISRAIKAGVAWVSFDPRDIFEAAGWRCYICQADTSPDLRGTREPNAPELDHVVPISRGGAHTPENSDLACRRCNWRKGTQLIEEMRIRVARVSPEVLAAIPRNAPVLDVVPELEQVDAAQLKAAALEFEVLLGRFVGNNFEMDPIYRKYTIKQGYLEAVRDALNAFRYLISHASEAEVSVEPSLNMLAAHIASDAAARISKVTRKQAALGKVVPEALEELLGAMEELTQIAQGHLSLAGGTEFRRTAWARGR